MTDSTFTKDDTRWMRQALELAREHALVPHLRHVHCGGASREEGGGDKNQTLSRANAGANRTGHGRQRGRGCARFTWG